MNIFKVSALAIMLPLSASMAAEGAIKSADELAQELLQLKIMPVHRFDDDQFRANLHLPNSEERSKLELQAYDQRHQIGKLLKDINAIGAVNGIEVFVPGQFLASVPTGAKNRLTEIMPLQIQALSEEYEFRTSVRNLLEVGIFNGDPSAAQFIATLHTPVGYEEKPSVIKALRQQYELHKLIGKITALNDGNVGCFYPAEFLARVGTGPGLLLPEELIDLQIKALSHELARREKIKAIFSL